MRCDLQRWLFFCDPFPDLAVNKRGLQWLDLRLSLDKECLGENLRFFIVLLDDVMVDLGEGPGEASVDL